MISTNQFRLGHRHNFWFREVSGRGMRNDVPPCFADSQSEVSNPSKT